ncbi:hypothetical protein OpiT1DRAFT_03280 [Opitutaceae bacterium TAV1]|nr:hypothetical protein OpiT1DRAFT_03280 [Opitutaceae bacterium TAV1]
MLTSVVPDLFRTLSALPGYTIPDNHDTHIGPNSILSRKAFLNAQANILVFRDPRFLALPSFPPPRVY